MIENLWYTMAVKTIWSERERKRLQFPHPSGKWVSLHCVFRQSIQTASDICRFFEWIIRMCIVAMRFIGYKRSIKTAAEESKTKNHSPQYAKVKKKKPKTKSKWIESIRERTSHQRVEQCSLNWWYRHPKSSFMCGYSFFVVVAVVTLAHRFKVYSTIQVIFGGLLIIRSLYLFICVSFFVVVVARTWFGVGFVLGRNLVGLLSSFFSPVDLLWCWKWMRYIIDWNQILFTPFVAQTHSHIPHNIKHSTSKGILSCEFDRRAILKQLTKWEIPKLFYCAHSFYHSVRSFRPATPNTI